MIGPLGDAHIDADMHDLAKGKARRRVGIVAPDRHEIARSDGDFLEDRGSACGVPRRPMLFQSSLISTPDAWRSTITAGREWWLRESCVGFSAD